jgi:hypothetical protein
LYLCSISGIVLSLILLGARLLSKYFYREIEDIKIFDRSEKQTLDFDSPAILLIYFQELRAYEDESRYYKLKI